MMPTITVTTRARDEAQDACGRVYFPHRLTVLDPQSFGMSLSAIDLGRVRAGVLAYRGEVLLETAELETGYEVNVPLDGPLRTWTGHADVCATPQLAAVYRPDGRTTMRGWAGGGRLFGLRIERGVLEDTLADLIDRPVRAAAPLGATLDLSSGPGRQWWRLARVLMDAIEDPDGPLAAPVVARPLAHGLVVALLHAVDHPWRGLLAAPPRMPRASAVRDAVALIEAEPEAPWTVGVLARRVGVGSRALQDAFARHVGMPPMAYLRKVRLQRVHADLRAADPARTTVTDIALRWGFTHHGRFAAAYRARYGQLPSDTLAQD
ncbi:transcriptional regulator, AraC family [Pseudonocardia thermophila]|uniref:Transcriptional regulator, AraC family n=2 Tax=Pseudonocardia thermophila TaxID=1848 RepID=A0A1M6ZYU2_PSETH|nr:AraC family transcriptional regulator [Pseudonocardia thermophila]SHL35576.1 transcriptional regulator, AraC family [Pseudonocardia thermophila]